MLIICYVILLLYMFIESYERLTTQSGVSVAVEHSIITTCRLTQTVRLITGYISAVTKQNN